MVTTTEGTVIVADADFAPSLAEVAVSVTLKLLAGALLGAVYVAAVLLAVAAGETLPHAVAEHEIVQVTPLFAESPVTIAVNGLLAPTCTVAELGVTDTVMALGTVMVTEDVFVVSATEVAVRVTVKLVAGVPGAV